MSRIYYLVSAILLLYIETSGQCPEITLNNTSGTICGITSVTISGTFSGRATNVTISEDGKGSIKQDKASSSPFTFTYIPKKGDIGKKVTITVTTNDPPGKTCSSATVTYILNVNSAPPAPERGLVTQPTCLLPTGSVVLNRLPSDGTWTITRSPDGLEFTGTGTTTTVSGLRTGKYSFTVTNAEGCVSALSGDVNINTVPAVQTLKITDPAPVCFPSTADLTAPAVTMDSGPGLSYSYWENDDATISFTTPTAATEGTYYIKGTSAITGCFDIKPVKVTVIQKPVARAGPDKVLENRSETNLDAINPGTNETGTWSVLSGSGVFSDNDDAKAAVRNLLPGKNIFLWTISNKICPPSYDTLTVMVNVRDPEFPSLITPNMDGRNDYFVIEWNEMMGQTELIIFNRAGIQVYENMNYDNTWNGVDYKGNPLPDGTYFYLLKTDFGKAVSGFIVIRRSTN